MFDLPKVTDTHPFLLITDFDGTLTRHDFYWCAIRHLPQRAHAVWARFEAGELTHFEALHAIFAELPDDESRIMAIAREAGLDTDVREAIDRLWTGGWQTVVVSAGCLWYCSKLLAEQGIRVPVISNPGIIVPGKGLQLSRLPRQSAFYSETHGVDKAAVVRAALERFTKVAYAGDSLPDRIAAALVPSDYRFARGWLADRFESEGVRFRRFDRWAEIQQALAESTT